MFAGPLLFYSNPQFYHYPEISKSHGKYHGSHFLLDYNKNGLLAEIVGMLKDKYLFKYLLKTKDHKNIKNFVRS